MPRKRKFRQDLLNNGTLTSANGMELGRIDLVEGTFIINEQALYKWLLAGIYGNRTPVSTINTRFSATGGWSMDPAINIALLNMEQLKLIKIERNDDGEPTFVEPLANIHTAIKKLPKYTTRAEQLAGLEQLDED